jgi:hypothetical protein
VCTISPDHAPSSLITSLHLNHSSQLRLTQWTFCNIAPLGLFNLCRGLASIVSTICAYTSRALENDDLNFPAPFEPTYNPPSFQLGHFPLCFRLGLWEATSLLRRVMQGLQEYDFCQQALPLYGDVGGRYRLLRSRFQECAVKGIDMRSGIPAGIPDIPFSIKAGNEYRSSTCSC